jgi:rsbT co-antagonist protein RsbR
VRYSESFFSEALMAKMTASRIAGIVREHKDEILVDWMHRQKESISTRRDLMNESELQRQSGEFLNAFVAGANGSIDDIHAPAWRPALELLSRISESRAVQGFSPGETATFVFSLKQPLFTQLRKSVPDVNTLADETWTATLLLDSLGLYTMEVFQKSREGVITRQQQELLELSTPVVTLWQGILALPLIGTLDSARTQVVMESLLQRIVETGSLIAILDITGVPTVDTLVAQHLLKTVAAARLMGADCIISGIRPQIAQTIVHLGVDLNTVTTKATLADALAIALKRTGRTVTLARPEARDAKTQSSGAGADA